VGVGAGAGVVEDGGVTVVDDDVGGVTVVVTVVVEASVLVEVVFVLGVVGDVGRVGSVEVVTVVDFSVIIVGGTGLSDFGIISAPRIAPVKSVAARNRVTKKHCFVIAMIVKTM
jgi:hypothetical protein